MSTIRTGSIALALSLLFAGAMHFALTSDHMAESTILGIGFIVAAVLQTVLGLVALLPRIAPYRGVIALNTVLIALYVIHTTTGLPLPDASASDEASRGVFGSLEAIDAPSLLTKLAELVAITLALWLRQERKSEVEVTSTRRAA